MTEQYYTSEEAGNVPPPKRHPRDPDPALRGALRVCLSILRGMGWVIGIILFAIWPKEK